MASGTVVYGIDLGTTNSCLSRFTDGTFHVVQIDGQDTVPSVVAWDGKDIVVGKRALNQARLTPHQAIRSIKRQMGRPDQVVQLAGKDWTPVEVSSQILAYIRSSAQSTLGESIRDVVITVPAWFTDPQRRATVQAGELAGMNVTRIINEPTAAALTFENITVPKQVSVDHCLVYDLGGGTFDVSIVRMVGDVKEVLSSCGNVYLGGDDFDQRLAMRLADHIKETHQIDPTVDLAAMAHLRFLAEDAKIRLSTDVFADLHEFVNVAGKSIELRFRVDREMFNQLISDYIDGTVAKSNEALEQANLKSSDITRLLLVGGSTRIPLVSQKLREAFGLEPEGQIDQDLSVAYGAAIQAALDSGLTCDQVVIDVSPHSLGVAALGEMDLRYPDVAHHGHPLTFVPLVHRNSRLPTKFVERFYTADDDQRKIEIAVYQGESGLTSENILVGSFFVDLPRGMLAGSKIDIGFEYNASGIVQVTVSTPAGDKQLKSYSMDLGRTATVNSELKDDAELDAEYDFLDDEDDDEESKEAASPQVANFLIEKVEKALKGNSGLDYKVVAEQLEAYRQALLKGDDQRLDELEDQLYQWLEDQQASESHPM